MSLPKMRMEEISKSELVLDFLSLGYPQHFQDSFRFLESGVRTAFPRRTGNDKASGSAGLWLGCGLIPRVRIIDTVVQVEVIAVIGSTKGERKGRRGQSKC